MTDDIDTLSGHELSAAVAREVMGWAEKHAEGVYGGSYYNGTDYLGLTVNWKPHTDRNDAHRVLERCLQIGIAERVYTLICQQVGRFDFTAATGWGLLTVIPPVVCVAALRAVRASR